MKEFIQQVLSYLDFLLFLHNSKITHDRWILRCGLFVLFEISFQHIFFFLHLLLDLFIKVLISFVVTLSYFFVVCHNYKIIIKTYSFAISNESCKRYKKNNLIIYRKLLDAYYSINFLSLTKAAVVNLHTNLMLFLLYYFFFQGFFYWMWEDQPMSLLYCLKS